MSEDCVHQKIVRLACTFERFTFMEEIKEGRFTFFERDGFDRRTKCVFLGFLVDFERYIRVSMYFGLSK